MFSLSASLGKCIYSLLSPSRLVCIIVNYIYSMDLGSWISCWPGYNCLFSWLVLDI